MTKFFESALTAIVIIWLGFISWSNWTLMVDREAAKKNESIVSGVREAFAQQGQILEQRFQKLETKPAEVKK
jgi:hypothetical protein